MIKTKIKSSTLAIVKFHPDYKDHGIGQSDDM